MSSPPLCAACGHTRSDHRRGHTYPTPESPAWCMHCDCRRTWADIDADNAQSPERHDLEVRENHDGRFCRVACSCGWEHDQWRPTSAPTTRGWLRSDHHTHIVQTKRQEATA